VRCGTTGVELAQHEPGRQLFVVLEEGVEEAEVAEKAQVTDPEDSEKR